MPCSCGTDLDYSNCCARFLDQNQLPETPEQLMRSRYTAFTKSRIDYIENTQRDRAAKQYDKASADEWVQKAKWLSLDVLHSAQNGDSGEVEFVARYTEADSERKIHELSQFKRIDNKWFYVSGSQGQRKPNAKVSRNDPCPCGSGKRLSCKLFSNNPFKNHKRKQWRD